MVKSQMMAELTLQLKDESSLFYSYKIHKQEAKKARHDWADQISADDICWALGGPYLDKSYSRALISEALAEIRAIDKDILPEEAIQKVTSKERSVALRKAA